MGANRATNVTAQGPEKGGSGKRPEELALAWLFPAALHHRAQPSGLTAGGCPALKSSGVKLSESPRTGQGGPPACTARGFCQIVKWLNAEDCKRDSSVRRGWAPAPSALRNLERSGGRGEAVCNVGAHSERQETREMGDAPLQDAACLSLGCTG